MKVYQCLGCQQIYDAEPKECSTKVCRLPGEQMIECEVEHVEAEGSET